MGYDFFLAEHSYETELNFGTWEQNYRAIDKGRAVGIS
jgi:hypothetical protein